LERLRAALGLVLKKGRQPEAGVKTGAERKTNR
jgi:hypothetical protein